MSVRAALLVAVMAVLASSCGGNDSPRPFAGFERDPAPDVGHLTLPAVDPDGTETEYRLRPGEGGVLLVYFGYTSCPDVCPTTLADVRVALADLGDDAERVDLAMATIDPHRDSAEVLTGYVQFFVEEGAALRTTDEDRLREVTAVFGADFDVGTNEEGEIEVIHTGSLYAVDAHGRLALTWPFGTRADDLAADLEQLLDEAP